eukprot:IDg8731t1
MDAEDVEGIAGVECMREERIDLMRSVRPREQACTAENSRILRGLRVSTVMEVAIAVAGARETYSRKTKLGRWDLRSATSGPRDFPGQADVPVESWFFYQMKRSAILKSRQRLTY